MRGIVIGIAAVLTTVAGFVIWLNVIQSSCTVGVAGTQMTITIEGAASARAACDDMIASVNPQGSGYIADSNTPRGSLTCRYAFRGLTYTVRDTGLMLYGGSMCANIKQAAEGPLDTSTPVPSPH